MKILGEWPIVHNAAGEVNGASWGVWRPRMAASRNNGHIFFAFDRDNPDYETGGKYGPGPDNDPWWQYTHLWYISEFDGTGWKEIVNLNQPLALSGREPPLLMLGPGDELYIFGWPNKDPLNPKYGGAYPCLWRQSTGFTPEPLPGNWTVSPISNENWPYTGGSINIGGTVVPVQAITEGINPNYDVPGALRYAWATPVPGQNVIWQVADIGSSEVPYRAEVSYPILRADGGLELVSGIATTREEQGFPPAPAGTWDYIENGVYWWRIPKLGMDPGQPIVIHREMLTGPTTPAFYPFDQYTDPNGLHHLLVEWDGDDLPNGVHYSAAHVILQNDGSFAIHQMALPYTRLARMAQDLSGRFYFFVLYNEAFYVQIGLDGDTDGTKLGPVLQGANPLLPNGQPDPNYRAELHLTGTYPEGTEGAIYTELSGYPCGRSGTRGLSNVVNVIWNRYDYNFYHVQLELSTAAPVPIPTPPTPTPTDLEARVAVLEANWQRIVKALTP